MANHAIVRLDNMAGTTLGTKLASLKFYADSAPADIDNGNIVALDSLVPGEREVWKAVAPTAKSELGAVALVASPELMYDERMHNLDEFYNEADVAARGYVLTTGDVFSVTAEALDAAADIAVGNIVELQAGTKLKVVATATSGVTKVGDVIAIDKVGTKTLYVIRVD